MNEHLSHEAIRQQLGAYALGALDAEDAADVRAHVATCPACQRQLAELEQAAAVLPQALASLAPDPPPDLKGRVLAAVAGETAATGRNERRPPAALAVGSAVPVDTGTAPPGARGPRRRMPFGFVALARVAAAAVVLLALGWSFRLADALEQERAMRAEFAALVSQQEVVLEVVDSDKTVRRVLLTTEPDRCEPGTCSYGKLFTRTDLRHVVAMSARLPAPPDGRVYRLWLTESGVSQPVGTMTLDDKGFGLLVFDADDVGPTYERAELVLQPEQSRTPEGDVVLRWTPSSAS